MLVMPDNKKPKPGFWALKPKPESKIMALKPRRINIG